MADIEKICQVLTTDYTPEDRKLSQTSWTTSAFQPGHLSYHLQSRDFQPVSFRDISIFQSCISVKPSTHQRNVVICPSNATCNSHTDKKCPCLTITHSPGYFAVLALKRRLYIYDMTCKDHLYSQKWLKHTTEREKIQ